MFVKPSRLVRNDINTNYLPCSFVMVDTGCQFDDAIDMKDFWIPEGFDIDEVVRAVTKVSNEKH